MSKRLIFLDIDGVLVWHGHIMKRCDPEEYGGRTPEWNAIVIDPEKVELINQIIQRTGADVVISSIWRMYGSLDYLQKTLEVKGFKGKVVGKTPHLNTKRGIEIARWVEDARMLYGIDPPETFVIIDDDNDMDALDMFLVLTSMETGITQEHVEKACKILTCVV